MTVKSMQKSSVFSMKTIYIYLISLGVMGAGFCLLLSLDGESDFHFDLGKGRFLDIYCEGAFFYEPPGFVSYSIKQNEKVLVPKHEFCSIGPMRVPSGRLEMVSTEDRDTIAIRRNFNVIILHDFKTNRTWPGKYGRVDWSDYLLARELLERFKQEGKELYCHATENYLLGDYSSPDGKYLVKQIWEEKRDRAKLKIRVFNQKEEVLCELQPREEVSIPWSEKNDLRRGWRAGWLSERQFGYWDLGEVLRIWKILDDGTCIELPAPLDAKLVEQMKSLPERLQRNTHVDL